MVLSILNTKTKRVGIILAITAAIAWGTYSTFLVLMYGFGMSDMAIVALAPTVLAIWFLIKVLIRDPKDLKIDFKLFLLMTFEGAILLNLINYAYVQVAVAGIPLGIISTLAFCNVLVLMITTKIVFEYKFTLVKSLAAFIAVIGVSLVFEVYKLGAGSLNTVGMLWALFLPVALGTAYTMNKYFLVKGLNYEVILFYVNFTAAAVIWATMLPPWT